MKGPEVEALEAQSADLVSLLGELSDEEWERDTRCPGWTVKELAAHCEGMLERLVGENAGEAGGEAEVDRAAYYAYDPASNADEVRERALAEVGGRSAAEILTSLHGTVDGAIEGVREIPGERVIQKSGHRMAFGDLVATRVLELGVHAMDIGHATLRGERIHPDAVPIVTQILDGRLGAPLPTGMGWDPRTYILTGTGRRRLEPNERFVLGPLAERFPLLG